MVHDNPPGNYRMLTNPSPDDDQHPHPHPPHSHHFTTSYPAGSIFMDSGTCADAALCNWRGDACKKKVKNHEVFITRTDQMTIKMS